MKKISAVGQLDRTSALLLIMMYSILVTLPLVWMRLFGITITPYHVCGGLATFFMFFVPGAFSAIRDAFKAGKFLWLAGGLMIVSMVLSYTKENWIFEPIYFLKFFSFFTISFSISVITLMVIRQRMLVWLAPLPLVVVLVFLILISIAFANANIDPLALLELAAQRADPNVIIQQLMRATFLASNEAVDFRANLKTTLGLSFLPVLPIGILAIAYIDKGNKFARFFCFVGVFVALFLAIVPFSRSAWLALAIMILCYAIMLVRSATGLAILVGGLIIGIPALSIIISDSDIAKLIDARLESEDSMYARVHASEEHWEAIGRSPLFGRSDSFSAWSHNVMLDSWSAFGIIGLAGAVLFFGTILAVVIVSLLKGLSAPRSVRTVHCTIAALMCPGLVRMVTVPNVTMDFPVWVGIGVAIGIAAEAWSSPARKATHVDRPQSSYVEQPAPSVHAPSSL